MIQHSAFPPFKMEHRYKGVYERAGFDVNLNGISPSSDGKSIKSPGPSKFPPTPMSSNSAVNVSQMENVPQSPYMIPSSANTNKSFGDVPKAAPYPTAAQKTYPKTQPNSAITPNSAELPYPHTSRSEGMNDVDRLRPEMPTKVVIQQGSPQQKDLPPPSQDGFVFIPSGAQNKNLKNLSLNLDKSDPVADRADCINDADNEITRNEFTANADMPRDEKLRPRNQSQSSSIRTAELLDSSQQLPDPVLPSPPDTSTSFELQPDDTFIRKQRLSSALDNFKRDIEDHKNYVPISAPNSPALKLAPELPSPSPPQYNTTQVAALSDSNHDGRLSYNQSYADKAASDPSHQFQNFKSQEFADDSHLNSDYQNFLELDSKTQPRHSQMSMVSSIISKDSIYVQDSEVDETLQRQLDALKVGETGTSGSRPHNLSGKVNPPGNPFSREPEVPSIPTFNIESAEEVNENTLSEEQTQNTFPQERSFTEPDTNILNENADADKDVSENSVDPLLFDSKRSVDVSSGTADSSTIEPLFPKSHHVEEELKNIKFPQQVQKPDIRGDNSIKPDTYPPAKGPCRVCKGDDFSETKGPNKSIYSRTGELSGQWHRSCFTCAYPSCSIQFNKLIPCYAFDDNAYCHNHYHELNGTLCHFCSNGIEGECVENELKQKWHLSCLKCHKCQNQINTDYYLINGSTYCEKDANNIINGEESYKDSNGDLKVGGLSNSDTVEKRRTRIMYVD